MYVSPSELTNYLIDLNSGVAILTINSTKNHETLCFSCNITKTYNVFHVSEKGWGRRGGKGEGSCGEFYFRIVCQNIIPLSLFKLNLVLL